MKPSIWPVLVGTGVFLGLGVPLAKAAAAAQVGALAFAFWPTLAAGLVLVALGRLRHGAPALTLADLRFGAISGLFGHALPMSAAYWLSAEAGAGFTALAFTLPPVFTLAITLLIGIERPVWRRVGGVAIGLTGAVLFVVGRGTMGTTDSLGALWLVVAIPAVIAAANVYRSLRLPRGLAAEWLSGITLLSSSVILAVVGLATGGMAVPPAAPAIAWLALQALALVAGYILYFLLQQRAEPVTFSFMGYVVMATGVAIGTAAFGERLPWTTLPALALIGAALWMMKSTAARRPGVPGR
ncbi:DMT family transporter [Rubrivivax sp. RP6-9]|uniref:DMT family transporter n=1 Tax=Rubrivivax sp. RP6-9 TaxID=3415750 RepID=UPI003CC577B0